MEVCSRDDPVVMTFSRLREVMDILRVPMENCICDCTSAPPCCCPPAPTTVSVRVLTRCSCAPWESVGCEVVDGRVLVVGGLVALMFPGIEGRRDMYSVDVAVGIMRTGAAARAIDVCCTGAGAGGWG